MRVTGDRCDLAFREAGRLFQIHVVLGPKAGADERAVALKVLDSLEVSPS